MASHPHNSMGLAEAALHLVVLSTASWILARMSAARALAVIEDRCPDSLGRVAERLAARSVDRLRCETMRLGPETAPARAVPSEVAS